MRINKLILKNFRGYKSETIIDFNDFSVLIGRNDIGKSTVLEALDIFFNDKKANSPYSKADLSVSGSSEALIGIVFSDLPDTIIVDTSIHTTFDDEYMLNENSKLQINKVYGASGVKKIEYCSISPTKRELRELITKKIDELRAIADELEVPIENYNGSQSSSIRKAIYQHCESQLDLRLQKTTILKTSDKTQNPGKEILSQIESYFPVYSLFQSDRKNEEKDSEVQSPMNSVIQKILKDPTLQTTLDSVKSTVETAAKQVAASTIEKLKEMNPEIADSLTPIFSEPKWESVFKFNLFNDEGISLDKRGSGVRRLILLNFFRAQAEKTRHEKNVPHIIYALEEPETSQHPKHQMMLIDAFKTISEYKNNQVILTTHSPGISKLVNPDSLILLDTNESDEIVAKSKNDEIFRKISEELGVMPSIELSDITNVQLAICVEGKNDISFLKKINQLEEFQNIIDLNDDRIIILPMGGSTLQYWVNNDYLSKLNLKQFHLYDSDIGSDQPHKYNKYIEIINSQENANQALETSFREMENLFPISLLHELYNIPKIDFEDYDEISIPELIAKNNYKVAQPEKDWDELEKEDKKERMRKVKNQLNMTHIESLKIEHLIENGNFEEVRGWFEKIRSMITE
ncbi:ATP-binding protein [Marispirochaeta sp.]|uniref:ATP-binding protein n=1 Tax=Marispirochaeta sp. TaxID=2038653 RepID=UPI0029C81B13|nr:ATP-binding protein [Marispirochaeta sp.]